MVTMSLKDGKSLTDKYSGVNRLECKYELIYLGLNPKMENNTCSLQFNWASMFRLPLIIIYIKKRKRLNIVTVTIFKEYLIVTVTKFRK